MMILIMGCKYDFFWRISVFHTFLCDAEDQESSWPDPTLPDVDWSYGAGLIQAWSYGPYADIITKDFFSKDSQFKIATLNKLT